MDSLESEVEELTEQVVLRERTIEDKNVQIDILNNRLKQIQIEVWFVFCFH